MPPAWEDRRAPCGPRAECCQASPGWPPGRSSPRRGPCLQLRSLSMPWILSHQPVSSVTEVLPLAKYLESDPPSVLLSLAAVLLLFMLVTPPLARAAVPDAPHASLQSVLAPTLCPSAYCSGHFHGYQWALLGAT